MTIIIITDSQTKFLNFRSRVLRDEPTCISFYSTKTLGPPQPPIIIHTSINRPQKNCTCHKTHATLEHFSLISLLTLILS